MSADSDRHSIQQRIEIEPFCTEFESNWRREDSLAQMQAITQKAPAELQPLLLSELSKIDRELRQSHGIESTVDTGATKLRSETESFTHEVSPSARRAVAVNHPERVDHYRLIEVLNRGGNAIVYKAFDEHLERLVAVKTLIEHPFRLSEQRARLENEAKAVAGLEHENIVSVYGFGESDNTLYIAMQLVEGHDLTKVISGSGNVKPETAVDMLLQATKAVAFAHQRGVLHRDIKPANILVHQETQTVKVADFGLAKLLQDDPDLTNHGDIVGTLRYLAPEALEGQRDERSDVYCLGLTLYELLTRRPAFDDHDRNRLLKKIVRESPPAPRLLAPGISRDLETIVLKAISREPAERYQTAQAMADDLQRYLDGKPVWARRNTLPEKAWKWCRRHRSVAALSAALLLFLLVGIPVFALQWQRNVAERKLNAEVREANEAADYAIDMVNAQTLVGQQRLTDATKHLRRWTPGHPRFSTNKNGSDFVDRRDWEWNFLNNQMQKAKLTFNKHRGSSIYHATISSNGLVASSGGAIFRHVKSQREKNKTIVWELESGKTIHTFHDPVAPIVAAAFSPDNSRLATISLENDQLELDGRITIWDLKNGEQLKTLELNRSQPEYLILLIGKPIFPTIHYTPDGKHIVFWSGGNLTVCDARSLETIWERQCDHGNLHPDGNSIFANYRNRPILQLNTDTGKILQRIPKLDTKFDRDLTFSKTGDSFSLARVTGTLDVYSSSNWEKISTFPIKNSRWASITPDGKHILNGKKNGSVSLVPMDNSLPNREYVSHDQPIADVAFSPNGNEFITCDAGGLISVWTKAQQLGPKELETKHSRLIVDLAFDPSGRGVYFATDDGLATHVGFKARIGWVNLENQQVERQERIKTTFFLNWPRQDFAFSPDGAFIAFPAREDMQRPKSFRVGFAKSHRINIIRSIDGKIVNSIRLKSNEYPAALKWSSDKNQLAILLCQSNDSKDGPSPFAPPNRIRGDAKPPEVQTRVAIAKLTNSTSVAPSAAPTQEQPNKVEIEPEYYDGILAGQWPVALGCSSNGSTLAALTFESLYVLRNEPQNQTLEKVIDLPVELAAIDVDPSGRFVAGVSADSSELYLIDIENRNIRYVVDAPKSACSVKFSPNGRRLAVVGYDGLGFFCDAATGRRLVYLDGSDEHPGNEGFSPKIIFSPDGQRIALSAYGGRITVWEAEVAPQN